MQVNSINLGGHGQACPDYPKYQVCKIFVVSLERSGRWSWILYRWVSKFFVSWCYHFFEGHDKACLRYLNVEALQYIKSELSYEVDISHGDKHENLLQGHNWKLGT